MNNKRICIFFILLIVTISLFGQTGEEGNDCTYSKEIIIPFNYVNNTQNTAAKVSLKQTVFYSHRDQFTFWYKIAVKENTVLTFEIDPLNDSDSYSVYVYQYNQPDFCNKLYNRKIVPASASFFLNPPAKKSIFDLSPKTFRVQKDNIYYISVINTSLNNCGHNFSLAYGTDTLKVKAIHVPCKRDFSTVTIKPLADSGIISKQTKHPNATISPIDFSTQAPVIETSDSKFSRLLCTIRESTKNSILRRKPVVIDVTSGDEIAPTNKDTTVLEYKVEKGKSYKIKCAFLGYKSFEKTIEIDKFLTQYTILAEPLKQGDIFIMKSIYFYPNTYALKKESAFELQKLLSFLVENEGINIEIQGHTNGDHRITTNKNYASMSEEWNFKGSSKELSQKRAEVIKNYLVANRVASTRLFSKGFGGKKPIIKDPQDNEEGQQNIRVEIVILKN